MVRQCAWRAKRLAPKINLVKKQHKKMDNNQLEILACGVCGLAKSVGAWIKEQVGTVERGEIEIKAFNSLVSYVDKSAEQKIIAGLGEMLPEGQFVAEESAPEEIVNQQDYFWIIDPLDGTTNFLHQIPFFSISIALYKAGEILLAVVFEVNREELFYSWRGAGATYLNGKQVRVSQNEVFADGLLATGFPYYDFRYTRHYLHLLEDLMQSVRGLRRLGSAALDLAYTACGRFDGFFEYSLSPWDVAAGAFLVQQAGGVVTDFDGENNYLFGKSIIAANPSAHAIMQEKIATHFNQL
jgi:myo-inositol-1(or 4)-monophosphatase